MTTRFATIFTLCLMALPLTACGGGDDHDAAAQNNPWAGKTYLLTVQKTEWSSPRGIGNDIADFVPSFILKIGDSGDASVTIGAAQTEATPADAVQDLCTPTPAVGFSHEGSASSEIAPSVMRVHIANANATPPVQVTGNVYDLKLTNVLPNGSTPATGGTFEATMDFRELYPLFTQLLTPTPDNVCSTLHDNYTSPTCMDPSCEVSCQPCPTADAAPYCLTVKAEGVGAVEAPGLTLTPVDEATRPSTCAD